MQFQTSLCVHPYSARNRPEKAKQSWANAVIKHEDEAVLFSWRQALIRGQENKTRLQSARMPVYGRIDLLGMLNFFEGKVETFAVSYAQSDCRRLFEVRYSTPTPR